MILRDEPVRMTPSLRIAALALALLVGAPPAVSAQPVAATDVLGRQLSLPAPARRVVLAQGRLLPALAFVLRDPVRVLAGIGGDFRRQDPPTFALYVRAFPALETVPAVGEGTPETLPIETIVALQPDLVVLSRSLAGGRRTGQAGGDLIERLEAAGLKVAVVDFFIHPLADTVPSLRALGRLLGAGDEAEAFAAFYEARLARVKERVAGLARPAVFMHAHAGGTDCCFSPGRGTFNDMIEAAGGRNIAAGLLPGVTGQLSLEAVIAADPALYVATGGVHLARRGGLVLGYGVPEEAARASFARLLADPGIGAVGAVARGRAFALAHLFNDTPLHIAAVEALAARLHPERFADVDPQATIDEINRRFLAVPATGTFWMDAPAR